MAPDLSTEERLGYLDQEREFVKEVLEDADDCKWAYQALIECSVIEGKLKGGLAPGIKRDIASWIQKLRILDPLRNGRWLDMEAAIR